ncbi:MAG: hypothetical protein OXH90_12710 [Paracoccaceae bacterium]|nr:hypothetical protein [Paracoccaceae bacterium]MDE2917418.1 hypothetical protein [Paracoccaceae bacterium]
MESRLFVWIYRILFICLSFLILVINLIPVSFSNGFLTFPNLLYCLTASWIFRRPDYVTAPMILGIFLFQDILLGLPIGLGTFLMLAIFEFFRSRIELVRYQPFLIEWGLIAVSYLIFLILYQSLLIVTFSRPALIGTLIFQFIETLLIYPVVVFFSSSFLKVKFPQFSIFDQKI